MFPGFHALRLLCSQNPLFPGFYLLSIVCSQALMILCSAWVIFFMIFIFLSPVLSQHKLTRVLSSHCAKTIQCGFFLCFHSKAKVPVVPCFCMLPEFHVPGAYHSLVPYPSPQVLLFQWSFVLMVLGSLFSVAYVNRPVF